MDQLIESIRAGTATGATAEQKAAGVQACRTIIAALDTEPGKPLVPPIAVPASTRSSLDQILDMAIAKLTTIANAHDVAASAAQKVSPAATQLPPGLRVPVAPPGRTDARPAKVPQIVHKPRAQSPAHPASPIRHEPRDQSPAARPTPTRKA